eukprot:1687902-Pyramimonas_sp.AAC.1
MAASPPAWGAHCAVGELPGRLSRGGRPEVERRFSRRARSSSSRGLGSQAVHYLPAGPYVPTAAGHPLLTLKCALGFL